MVSLQDSFALVADSLPNELVAPRERQRLASLAALLPPTHRAGFECRLAAADDHVDFQQAVPGDDITGLRELTRLAGARAGEAGWSAVGALAQRLLTAGDSVHDGLTEIWLEFDLAESSRGPTLDDLVPSVFAVMAAAPAAQRRRTAEAFLNTVLGPGRALAARQTVRALADACPPPADLTHLGVMLGRAGAGLRVHVSPIPLASLQIYLERIGAPEQPRVLSLARSLLDYCDRLIVCLDIAGSAIARVGLEAFFEQKHGTDPRWRPLLDQLIALELAMPEKAAALLRWPGPVTPLDAPGEWPEDLIVAGLTQPSDTLDIIDRRLSHVKVTCAPGLAPVAKAYFGFGHVSVAASVASAPAPTPRRRQTAQTVDTALARTTDWLLSMRNQGGWWRDFFDRARPHDAGEQIVGYASDEWVTAFVATALAELAHAPCAAPAVASRARDAAEHALELLLHRRGGSGWGYHALLPPDADTTTWVLRLAATLGTGDGERLAAGRAFLEAQTRPDGGVATYPQSAAGQLERFLRMRGSYAGWCATHACVTAAAAAVAPAPARAQYVRAAQRPDGSWSGHWWDDDEYATTRAVEALVASPQDEAAVDAARSWCARRVDDDGGVRPRGDGDPSPFATALVLHAIALPEGGGETERRAAHRARQWLLAHQLQDGSWEASARLRVPPPDALDPLADPRRTLTYVDDERIFTTATVVAALAASSSRRGSASA